MYHAVLNIVCSETFSEKRKETELHRKYTLFGGPAGSLSPPTILQIKQIWWFYFIYHDSTHSFTFHFLEFLNNKHLRSKWIYFSSKNRIFCIFFFVLHVFTGNRSNIKNGMWRSRQLNFLQNDACFSLLGQKLWEEIHLGWRKVCFSGEEKKYNYVSNNNVNNNKTADMLCLYYYIDEIIIKNVKKKNSPYPSLHCQNFKYTS